MRLAIPFSLATLLAVPALAAPTPAPPAPTQARGHHGMDSHVTVQMSGGRLGAQLQDLTDDLRGYFGAPLDAGVLVAKVQPDSPAAKAGLRAGDVLVDIDGTKIGDPGDAIRTLLKKAKGTSAQLRVIRARQSLTLTAALRDSGMMGIDPDDHMFAFDFDGAASHDWVGPGMKMFGNFGGMQQKIDALEGRLKDLEQKLKALEQRK